MLNAKEDITDFNLVKSLYNRSLADTETFVKQKPFEDTCISFDPEFTSANFSWRNIMNVHKDLYPRVILVALLQ